MNAAHLHLVLNHAPLFALLIGTAVVAVALWRPSDDLMRAGLILVVLGGAATVPAFLSGEPAEDAIEELPGVSEELIDEHEESADYALWGGVVAGLVALAALAVRRRRAGVSRKFALLAASLGFLAVIIMARTAYLGGQIRHPEIRSMAPGGASGASHATDPEDR